jgi:hypothetical protein
MQAAGAAASKLPCRPSHVDPNAERHLEVSGPEWRRKLVLDDLDPRLIAYDLLAPLDLGEKGAVGVVGEEKSCYTSSVRAAAKPPFPLLPPILGSPVQCDESPCGSTHRTSGRYLPTSHRENRTVRRPEHQGCT